jgi:hypothetical protein
MQKQQDPRHITHHHSTPDHKGERKAHTTTRMVLENDTTGNASTNVDRVDTTLTTSTTSTSSSSSTATITTTTTRQKRTTTHTVESQNADGGGDYQRTSTTSTSTLVERKAPYHGPRQQQQHEEADSEEEEVEWVTDIDELAELFERREPLGRRRVRGICGRVTKGRTEDDFRLLSDEPNKRYNHHHYDHYILCFRLGIGRARSNFLAHSRLSCRCHQVVVGGGAGWPRAVVWEESAGHHAGHRQGHALAPPHPRWYTTFLSSAVGLRALHGADPDYALRVVFFAFAFAFVKRGL